MGDIKNIGTPLSRANPRNTIQTFMDHLPDTAQAVAIVALDSDGVLLMDNSGVAKKDLLWALEKMKLELMASGGNHE